LFRDVLRTLLLCLSGLTALFADTNDREKKEIRKDIFADSSFIVKKRNGQITINRSIKHINTNMFLIIYVHLVITDKSNNLYMKQEV